VIPVNRMAERPDLCDLTAEDIAPLERLFDPLTPETWRDFARSLYLTLLTLFADSQKSEDLAEMAMQLTRGIASDMGGAQPYIPVGSQMTISARMRRVIDLCATGKSYADVARIVGNITESRVRHIERAWRQEQRALRQGKLDLE